MQHGIGLSDSGSSAQGIDASHGEKSSYCVTRYINRETYYAIVVLTTAAVRGLLFTALIDQKHLFFALVLQYGVNDSPS